MNSTSKTLLSALIISLFSLATLQGYRVITQNPAETQVLGDTTSSSKTVPCDVINNWQKQYCAGIGPTAIPTTHPATSGVIIKGSNQNTIVQVTSANPKDPLSPCIETGTPIVCSKQATFGTPIGQCAEGKVGYVIFSGASCTSLTPTPKACILNGKCNMNSDCCSTQHCAGGMCAYTPVPITPTPTRSPVGTIVPMPTTYCRGGYYGGTYGPRCNTDINSLSNYYLKFTCADNYPGTVGDINLKTCYNDNDLANMAEKFCSNHSVCSTPTRSPVGTVVPLPTIHPITPTPVPHL